MRFHLLLTAICLLFYACKKEAGTPAPTANFPVLSTTTVSQLGTTSVKTGGTITASGNGTVSARGVCWGTAAAPTIVGNHTTEGSGTGSFESTITGLTPATTYYLRAYASNQDGTAYGTELSFTTLTPDVYVAGYEATGGAAISAVIWKNGVPTRLTNGDFEAQAYAVYVSGTDVYAAGYEKNASGAVPKVWKNGTATALSAVPESYAYNVFVSGTDVYVAGEINGPPALAATVWKNGSPMSLDAGTDGSYAQGLFVNGNDVYTTGLKFTGPATYMPAIWKNGVVSFPSSIKGSVNAVYVYNNDIYACGYELNGSTRIGKFWKNGVPVTLGNGTNVSTGSSVYVNNGDVYVAYSESVNGIYVAKYWKNGTVTSLTDGTRTGVSTGIVVLGNDVYVAGTESNGTRNVPKIWKNGVGTNLTDGNSFAGVNGIFVK